MITIRNKPAGQTDVKAILQRLTNLCPACACLTRAARIDFHQHTPSVLSFVREFEDEVRPSGVVNTLSKSRSRQSFDVQIFDGDQAILIHQPTRQLVMEVCALCSYVGMDSLQQDDCLAPPIRTLLATCYAPLGDSQATFCFPVVSRAVNCFAGRKRGEVCQSHVNADSVRIEAQRLRFNPANKNGEPPISLPLNCQSLNPMYAWHYYFFHREALAVATRYMNALHHQGHPPTGKFLVASKDGGYDVHFYRLGCWHVNQTHDSPRMHDQHVKCPDCGFEATYDSSG